MFLFVSSCLVMLGDIQACMCAGLSLFHTRSAFCTIALLKLLHGTHAHRAASFAEPVLHNSGTLSIVWL